MCAAREFDIKNESDYNFYKPIKIRNFDTYEPVSKELQSKYITTISQGKLLDYQKDMSEALEHILYDKITFNNKTFRQMLLDFNKKSDMVYQKYLENKNDIEQNKIFEKQLDEMNGTISLYPNAIIEELLPTLNKYSLNIEPSSESDVFLYKYYVEKYQIKHAKEFKELLQLKEYTFTKIFRYQLEVKKNIAHYRPIPKNLSAQYRAEVMEIINQGYPIAVKETVQIRQKAHKMYLDVLKNRELYMDYATNNFDTNIDNCEFSLLSKILDVTAKYVPIKNSDVFATDYSGAIIEFLNPYFKDNEIETKKLDKLGALVNKKRKEIEREQETLHRYMYSKDIK